MSPQAARSPRSPWSARRRARWIVAAAAGTAVVAASVLATATPAAADPPRPSDYASTVTSLTPASATEAVDVSVTGAGAFLRLRAAPGHEVVVLGYDGEPYLRFLPDGTVEANQESPATYVNASLTGTADVPGGVDPADPPRWRRVAGDREHAWHDHRVHWMGTQPPSGTARGDEIRRWTVPLQVDGAPAQVRGRLSYAPAVAWWPWMLVLAAATAATWLLARRARRPLAVGTAAALAAGAIALGVAAAEQLSVPAEAGRRLLPVLVPAIATAAALAAVALLATGRRRRLAGNLGLAAVAAAVGWALLRLEVFTKPVLVTDLAPNLDRAGTALVLGLTLAAAGLLVRGEPDPEPTPEPVPGSGERVRSGSGTAPGCR